MGVRNVLVEGVSGSGKTSVCRELRRRGHHAVNGDTELAYQGDPVSGEPTTGRTHDHHLWRVDEVRTLVADRSTPATFFCGGSRNHATFLDLFDAVVVLDLDRATLIARLAARGDDEFGGRPEERDLVLRVHATGEDLPRDAVRIDATAPLSRVVDEILRHAG
ncbi:AAA family ATPase [Kineococcus sp. GCM10028916]|uniref:AAA family ATPase n=1 Tax=Kineococcus sp. GCM10028916 TaxID=3273394 RepID=UPI003626836E